MAIAKVQTRSNSYLGGSTSVSITATTGNFLLVIADSNVTPCTVSDGFNTYTPLTSGAGVAWYAQNITGGALTITVTGGGLATITIAQVLELSGVSTTAPIDKQVEHNANSTALTTGATAAAASASDYVVGLAGWGSGSTPYTISARAFSAALTSQTNEAQVNSGTSFGSSLSVAISHGPIAGLNAETFSGTLSSAAGYFAWCVLLTAQPVPPPQYPLHVTVGPNPATGLVAGQTCELFKASRFAIPPTVNDGVTIGYGTRPVRDQCVGNTSTAATSVAVAVTASAGDLLIAVVAASAGVTGISDSSSRSWTAVPVPGGSANYLVSQATTAAGGTLTVTAATGSGNNAISVLAVSPAGGKLITTDVQAVAFGTSTAPSSGASGVPGGANELVVGLVAAANAITAPTLTPTVTGTTVETVQSATGASVQIVDGPLASAVAETFSATIASGTWSAWVLLITEGGEADYGPLTSDTVVDFFTGGVETIVNTFENFYLSYFDPADTSNGGSWNTYWQPAPIGQPGSISGAPDVAEVNPAAGDLLTFNAATGKWYNAQPAVVASAPLGTLQNGYAQVTAAQGPTAPSFDITGLTVTVTVAAGRRIRITGHTLIGSSVGTDVVACGIFEGGTQLAQGQTPCASTTTGITQHATAVLTPSAGSHTYKLSALRGAGTGNLTNHAASYDPSYIHVEDIGV